MKELMVIVDAMSLNAFYAFMIWTWGIAMLGYFAGWATCRARRSQR